MTHTITRRSFSALLGVCIVSDFARAKAQSSGHIVMTGHMGNVGSRLFTLIPSVGIDKKAGSEFDLAGEPSQTIWRQSLLGASCVIHLATVYGDGKMTIDREEEEVLNSRLLIACLAANVPRIVFATSTWAEPARYRPDYIKDAPRTFYGAYKHAMEVRLRQIAVDGEFTAQSCRIGWSPAEDVPPSKNAWSESIRCHTKELYETFSGAITPRINARYIETDVPPLRPL